VLQGVRLNWDTDTWQYGDRKVDPPTGQAADPDQTLAWTSEGGLFRGCWSQVVVGIERHRWDQNPPPVTFTITTGWPWRGDFYTTCAVSDPDYGIECEWVDIAREFRIRTPRPAVGSVP
jgi:hypothetical protein